jgi:hypothetical protein
MMLSKLGSNEGHLAGFRNRHTAYRLKIAAIFLASGICPLGATTFQCDTVSIPGAAVVLTGINNAVSIVGSYQAVSNGSLTGPRHGYFSPGAGPQFVTFDYPGATDTQLLTINNNGLGVVLGQFKNGSTTGFFTVPVISPSTGVLALGTATPVTLPPPYDNANFTWMYGINDNGAISGVVSVANTPTPTFFILNADRTVTTVPGYNGQSRNLPGSLNKSLQMVESDLTFGETATGAADGTLTPVVLPTVSQRTYAFGINNLGTVAGFFSRDPFNAFSPPFVGFLRLTSGEEKEIICADGGRTQLPPPFVFLPNAVNDNNIVVGGGFSGGSAFSPSLMGFVAGPLGDGNELLLSSRSLTFPPTPVGQTSAAQTVTLSNPDFVGERTDIGPITAVANPTSGRSSFAVTGCVDPSIGTAILHPGESCTLSITANPTGTGQFTGSIIIDDTANGAPHVIALSVTGTSSSPPPPPSCQLTGVISGPPKQLQVTMQDSGSGLQAIQVTSAVNVTVDVPSFATGTVSPLVVTATKVDQSQSSEVGFMVTNVGGSSTSCDPVDFTAAIAHHTEEYKLRNVSSTNNYIRIINGTPGLEKIEFRVNGGDKFDLSGLPSGASRVLNIGSALHIGSNNEVELHASGEKGASAYILIGDSSIR